MKKKFENYYVGLDIGTDSLGWAVTDLNYDICKLNGKALWGIRLFEAGKSAEDRRLHRAARRRGQRKVQRIKLLQELFSEEIYKVDPTFFLRMEESKFFMEDKQIFQPFALFSDNSFTDKEYFKKYPTIYHLRKALIECKEPVDIRLVYLAIHHILKNRGHFLFEGRSIENISSFKEVFSELVQYLNDEFQIDLFSVDTKTAESILKNKKIGIRDKEKQLIECFQAKTKQEKTICGLLAGGTKSLVDLFQDESLDDFEIKKICFIDAKYEEQKNILEDVLLDKFYCLEKLKAICDWAILSEIRNGEKYLSYAKVTSYEKHQKELKLLKNIVKKYIPEKYREIFSDSKKGLNNYPAYISMTKSNSKEVSQKNSKKVTIVQTCSQEDLCKYLESVLTNISVNDEDLFDYNSLLSEITSRTLLPKQVVKDNGVIPFQVHQEELIAILDNAKIYLSFLNHKDETGFNPYEKILKIFLFRIPYYVGPLNDAHKNKGSNCWIVKKSEDKIRPWNFDDVVDTEASAENFICRMTNKCTYLTGANVLPKSSLLYSEFMVLNELNNLKINGEGITLKLKHDIFNSLFMKQKKVTNKRLRSYLESEGVITKADEISGIDGDFKTSMSSSIDFQNILKDKFHNNDMVEELIRWIVLFGEDNKLLKSRIAKHYSTILTEEEIKRICNLKYTGWGRLSKEFLTDIYHVEPDTGEYVSIISNLRKTNNNLMKLLSSSYDYLNAIKEYNNNMVTDVDRISYDLVDELYVSPALKRGIWQTLCTMQEIIKFTGHNPQKIFVEMARGEEEKVRTESRKNKLVELYKSCKDQQRNWIAELEQKSESDLRSDRLYLYYTQMGRCMYTNEPINLQDLFNANLYDVDHIYPRSKIKDDSLNNRVLVKRIINADKSDEFPLNRDLQNKCKSFWTMLFQKGFIEKKKFERLTRTTAFTQDELADFIARQLVETRQSTKAVADILNTVCKDSEIVYVKAGNVSEFRQRYEMSKVRDINDYHHAKDAYLNIVVGNVYNTKFTHSPINFIKKHDGAKYNLKRMYDFDVERGEDIAWKAGTQGTIALVKKNMSKNNILFTRYSSEAKGGFFDQMQVKAGSGQVPIKGSDSRFKAFDKYGGYNKAAGAYFMLVEHTVKKKRIRTIEFVPVYFTSVLNENPENKLKYCLNDLGLIEPQILISKIKINTLFNVDGFYMHLSGRTGSQLIFKGANQLLVSYAEEAYLKKVLKFVSRSKESRVEIFINEFDKITCDENLKIYDMFLNKLKNSLYGKRLGTQAITLCEKRDAFIELTSEKQCKFISELLHLFQCNSVSANFSDIGGAKSAGVLVMSNNISKLENISIVNQSITGVFSKHVDLLKL